MAYLEKTTVQYIGDFEETPQHVTVLGGLGRDWTVGITNRNGFFFLCDEFACRLTAKGWSSSVAECGGIMNAGSTGSWMMVEECGAGECWAAEGRLTHEPFTGTAVSHRHRHTLNTISRHIPRTNMQHYNINASLRSYIRLSDKTFCVAGLRARNSLPTAGVR